jgi:3-hydroxyacyl-CoA dehydrogenase
MPTVSLETHGKVGVIVIENPPVNAMSRGIPAGIITHLAEVNADPSLAGAMLMGGGSGTIAGADIHEFGKPWPAGEPGLRDAIAAVEASAKPVFAALAGSCLGGGLELAMGCHSRVAGPKTVLGQPEIALGFPPGAGGTQRLPRLIGAERALAMILDGKPIPAAQAFEWGLIDAVIEGDLRAGAVAHAEAGIATGGPFPSVRDVAKLVVPAGLFDKARADLAKRRGPKQAAAACIDCVEAATALPFDEGLAKERALFEQCLASEESLALRHVFFAERAAGKVLGVATDVRPRALTAAAVIGSGTMGGGIAMCFADAGIPVRLLDSDPAALQRGLATIRRNYAATAAKGRITGAEVEARMGCITPISGFDQIGDADIIIEAVFEEMAVKKDVFGELDKAAKPGAILASNTSYLDVDAIAATVSARAGFVLGTHFFSPANVMRLLEVVRTKTVSPETLATVLALGRRLKKVPVVSGVCYGFIGNRMLEGYLRQAEFLLEEGANPAQVDKVITDFGFPMGPFAMVDLAGLDVGWRKRKATAVTRDPKARYSPVNDRLCEIGRFGQKTGAGWYRYEKGSRAPIPDPLVDDLAMASAREQGITRRTIGAEEILERCLYPLVNEGAQILDDGVAARAGDIDTVWVSGYAFPAWKGGPMFWAERVGLARVLASIRGYGGEHDGWQPAPLLVTSATSGRWPG